MSDGEKVADEKCGKKKPPAKKECSLDSCPEWYIGGWGPVSITAISGHRPTMISPLTVNIS